MYKIKKRSISKSAKNSIVIGVVCIGIYLVNYYVRNMLSVNTPELLHSKIFSSSQIGILSSVYMFVYAIGQLINGFLGDYVNPKYMVCIGILTAGVVCIAFPATQIMALQILYFACLGFGLSMVRGPLMKIIAENTDTEAARIICAFFAMVSFLGAFIASFLAITFRWKKAFTVAGIIAIVMVISAFFSLTKLEKKKSSLPKADKIQRDKSVMSVFKTEKFGFYIIVGCIVEITATSISFWIPTYLTDYLSFGRNTANIIFSFISLSNAIVPFIALFLFKAIKGRDTLLITFSFGATALMFISLIFVHNSVLNVSLLILGKMATAVSSTVLWSIYLPGLGKTGHVSSANGIFDCSGYMAASVANLIFANLLSNVSWAAVIVIWTAVPLVGFISALAVQRRKASICVNGGV